MSSLKDLLATFSPRTRSNPDSLDLEAQTKLLHNDRYSSDTKHRKWLAIWTASVVTLWLTIVVIILILNDSLICLSDSVLNVLLGTTTLNVLGLSFIVLRGHFNTRNSPE